MELINLKKLKQYIFERFLPEYCRQKLLEENELIKSENNALQQKYDNLLHYVKGMENALRAGRRITVNNTVGRDK